MQSVQQTYVFNQTSGAVTEPVNGNWLQAYCEFLGVTQPVNSSWLQALCYHFGITEPLYGSWTIALANYYNITAPENGTWWYAISQASGTPPVIELIWNEVTSFWNQTDVNWATDTIAPDAPVWTGSTFPEGTYTPIITGTAEPYSNITLTADAQIYTGQTDALGDWSVQITNPLSGSLAPGTAHLVSVTATDNAGNVSPATDDYIYIVAPNTITLTLDMFDSYGDGWNNGWFQLEYETSPGVWDPIEYNENPFRFNTLQQLLDYEASGATVGIRYYKTDALTSSTPAFISGIYGLRFETFEPGGLPGGGSTGWKEMLNARSWTVPTAGNFRTVSKREGDYPSERSYVIKNGQTTIVSQPQSFSAWAVDTVQQTFTL